MFEWKPQYAVGISEIDRQHQELFRMAGEIYDMVLLPGEADHTARILELLSGFRKYADAHFVLEESLMARYDYPDMETHRQEHESFRSQVAELSAYQEANSSRQTVTELIKFVTQWIFKHVCTVDPAYGPLLRAQLH